MERFIGAWRLVSFQEETPKHEVIQPYGENPIGLIVYDSSGHVSVQIMKRNRASLSGSDWQSASAEEIRTALEGFTAFFGSFAVDEEKRIVTHHVEGHVFPGSVGKSLIREFSFADDLLILKPSPNRTLIWKKITPDEK